MGPNGTPNHIQLPVKVARGLSEGKQGLEGMTNQKILNL